MRVNYKELDFSGIYIWGNGQMLRSNMYKLKLDMNILGVIDSNPKKCENSSVVINGECKRCFLPKQLKSGDSCIVAIANMNVVNEIGSKLDEKLVKWCHISEIDDDINQKLDEVRNLFSDEISKEIFDRKRAWYFGGVKDTTTDLMYTYYSNSRIIDLEVYPRDTQFSICGAGKKGRKTLLALRHAGYRVSSFLDNDKLKQGKDIDGIIVESFVSFASRANRDENLVVIIDNSNLSRLFFSELVQLGVSQRQIFMTVDDGIRTAFGDIYFDLPNFVRENDEVFIDAGSYNGENTKDFIKWCDGKYKKVYALEPMSDGYELSLQSLDKYKNVEVLQLALGKEKSITSFAQSFSGMMGSRLGNDGDYVENVQVDTIDNLANDEKITFIKMDIEGAELAALAGAEMVLQRDKPKLAISLYHKNEDLYEIPLYLKKIVPEYSFYIRHYSNKRWDMVLYCVIE